MPRSVSKQADNLAAKAQKLPQIAVLLGCVGSRQENHLDEEVGAVSFPHKTTSSDFIGCAAKK
jgi:hypothetical protein